jgi:NADH-quinone oxidoreductase subunit M
MIMDFIVNHLLTLILFIPTLVALALVLVPADRVKIFRWVAMGASLLSFGLSLYLWTAFEPVTGFQFEEKYIWYETINSSYHLGVDGISLPMVMLTTLLTPLAILTSFSINQNVKPFMILILLLETGMLGVFLALDLLLFFVFWEIGLVPMYFLINQWGGKNRNYASLKFIIYYNGRIVGFAPRDPVDRCFDGHFRYA